MKLTTIKVKEIWLSVECFSVLEIDSTTVMATLVSMLR